MLGLLAAPLKAKLRGMVKAKEKYRGRLDMLTQYGLEALRDQGSTITNIIKNIINKLTSGYFAAMEPEPVLPR